jgi:hypothetical protein
MKAAMARIRSVHPGQWTAGDFLECSAVARLLALALRNMADDHGVFRWKPKTIKAECLPGDNCDIDQLLLELVTNNQVKRYAADGKEYGIIVDFTQWQRPKKPKYLHPVPDWFSTGTEPVPNDEDTEPEIPPQRKEVGGRREEVEESTPTPSAPSSSDAFSRFKAAYPRRDGANPWQPAEKKFKALVKTGVDPEAMIAAASSLAREEGTRGNIGTKFIPQAITWLNQQRFQDYAAAAFEPERSSLDWDAVLSSYTKFGHWSPQAGPDLSSPACRAPKEMLEKYGLELRRMDA